MQQYIFVMPSWDKKKLLFTDSELRDIFNYQYQTAGVNDLSNDARNSIQSLNASSGNDNSFAGGNTNGSTEASADFRFQRALEQFAKEKNHYKDNLNFNTGAFKKSITPISSPRRKIEEEIIAGYNKKASYAKSFSDTHPVITPFPYSCALSDFPISRLSVPKPSRAPSKAAAKFLHGTPPSPSRLPTMLQIKSCLRWKRNGVMYYTLTLIA